MIQVQVINKQIVIDQFTSIKFLEQGSFITCFTAIDKFQRKVILTVSDNERELQSRLKMANKLQNIHGVQKYYGNYKLTISDYNLAVLNQLFPRVFTNTSSILVGEYYNTNFKAYVDQLSINKKINVFYQIVQIVEELHSNDVYHMDLKPSNILFHNDQPVIIDFGLAVENQIVESSLNTSAYSPKHDVYAGQVFPDKFDIFCLGNILHEMLTKQTIFPSIIKDPKFQKLLQTKVGTLAANLITGMTKWDQEQRYPIKIILEHPLFIKSDLTSLQEDENNLKEFLNNYTSSQSDSSSIFVQQLSQNCSCSDFQDPYQELVLFNTRESLYDLAGSQQMSSIQCGILFMEDEDSLDL
ncbi:Kinase [Hexamita inflata]|uniref:Kinase n=1 Tax=Hexamita inflata TaxID=28002 RepID=A0ABP1KAX8_9EUKA